MVEGDEMTVIELCNQLNDVAKSKKFINSLDKVKNHTAFHDYMQKVFRSLLPDILHLYIWHVRLNQQEVLQYKREFTPFQNTTKKGHFFNVRFTVESGLDDYSIDELPSIFAERDRQRRIKDLIEYHRELGSNIVAVKRELNELMKDGGK